MKTCSSPNTLPNASVDSVVSNTGVEVAVVVVEEDLVVDAVVEDATVDFGVSSGENSVVFDKETMGGVEALVDSVVDAVVDIGTVNTDVELEEPAEDDIVVDETATVDETLDDEGDD